MPNKFHWCLSIERTIVQGFVNLDRGGFNEVTREGMYLAIWRGE
jgi:hypothetical protein